MEKILNSQFMRKTDELRSQEAWNWLKIVLLRKKRRNANDCRRRSTENKQA